MSETVLFLVHDDDPGRSRALPGTLGAHAEAAGLGVVVRPVWEPLPAPGEVSMVVVMGSAASAYDDSVPWLAGELAYLREAVDAGTPVLGVCFGGQVLSRVLGGEVTVAPEPEIGFVDVSSTDESLVPSGPWMEFHYDRFTVPPGATEIASSPAAVQAFTHGPHLGVQFHPEISPAVLAAWESSWDAAGEGDAGEESAEGARLAGTGIDIADVRAQVKELQDLAADRSRALLQGFRRRAGRPGQG